MTTPFVPIPFFPPYEHWRPGSQEGCPENENIRRWLEELKTVNLPFLDLWYCTSFIEADAHNWLPARARELYDLFTRVVEKMLNWSYLHGISILDWDCSEFCNFLIFLKRPPHSWCSSTRHRKFVENPSAPFSQWELNDKWRLFCRSINGSNFGIQTRADLQRSARVVRKFFEYYFSTVGITKDNFARNIPDFILEGMPANSTPVVHLPYELDWSFEQLLKCSAIIRRPEQILLYLAMARFSVIHIRHARNLSQFFKSGDGAWYFNNGDVAALDIKLSSDFCVHLKRILVMRGIDMNESLPMVPCFPTNDGVFPYCLNALQRHMSDFAGMLADISSKSEDPKIAAAEGKFRRMTFSSIRSSSEYYSVLRRRVSSRK